MGLFTRNPSKESLTGQKNITVNGMRFTIRRINPLIDFDNSNIPTIFSTVKPEDEKYKAPKQESDEDAIKQAQKDMYGIIQAGVVKPEIGPPNSEGKIGVDDLFRDPSIGVKLYFEILNHSLGLFKLRNRVFFWIVRRFSYLTLCVSGMVNALAVYSSRTKKPA